jgi:hypothetical protein
VPDEDDSDELPEDEEDDEDDDEPQPANADTRITAAQHNESAFFAFLLIFI